MNKNFLSKNILGLGILLLAVLGFIGYIVAAGEESAVVNNTVQTPNTQTIDDSTEDTASPSDEQDQQEDTTQEQADITQEQEPAEEAEPTVVLNMATVQTHATSFSCWTVISDKVYDVTDYINDHPGGDEILRACGEDGTVLFTTGRTDDGEIVRKDGGSHSTSAEVQLEKYLLGDLVN